MPQNEQAIRDALARHDDLLNVLESVPTTATRAAEQAVTETRLRIAEQTIEAVRAAVEPS